MKSRKFPTLDEAIAYLEKKGKLDYFGMIGNFEYYVYNLTLPNGTLYRLFVYLDGKVVVRDTVYPRF